MRMSGKSHGLFMKATNIIQTRLTSNRVDQMHTAAPREHKNPMHAGFVQKTDHIIGKFDQDYPAILDNWCSKSETLNRLLFQGCAGCSVFRPKASASRMLSAASSTMMSPRPSHARYSPLVRS